MLTSSLRVSPSLRATLSAVLTISFITASPFLEAEAEAAPATGRTKPLYRESGDYIGAMPTDYPLEAPSNLMEREKFIERLRHRMNNLPKYPSMPSVMAQNVVTGREDILDYSLGIRDMITGSDLYSVELVNHYARQIVEYASGRMESMEGSLPATAPYETALEAIGFLSEFTHVLEMMDIALVSIRWDRLRHHIEKALGHMLNIAERIRDDAYQYGMDPTVLGALESEISSTLKSGRSFNQSHRNFTAIGIKLEEVLRTYNQTAPFKGEQLINPGVYVKNKKAVIKESMRCWPVKTDRNTPFYLCTELKKPQKKKKRRYH